MKALGACFDRHVFQEALTVVLAVRRYAPAADDAAAELMTLADDRALPGPVLLDGRDFVAEAREELADACNYLVWECRRRLGQEAADGELDALERAIAGLAVTWQALALVPAPSLDTGTPCCSSGCDGGELERSSERPDRLPPAAQITDHPRARPRPGARGGRVLEVLGSPRRCFVCDELMPAAEAGEECWSVPGLGHAHGRCYDAETGAG